MSKTKSLLSFALAATMLFSTVFVGANAEDATPKTGTLNIGTATVEVGEPTATVDFTLTFDEAVKSPHSLCTIISDYELTNLAVKSVDGTVVADDENLAEGDDDLVSSATVKISNNGLNLAAKKVIFESGVDSNAPVVTTIVFTATFDTSAAVAGTSVVSAEIDATNYDENTFALTVNDGEIVVAEPHVCSAGEVTDNEDGTHDIACAGCDKLFADNEACNYVDGACSVCGAKEPVVGPVVDETLKDSLLSNTILIGNTFGFKYELRLTDDNFNKFDYDDMKFVVSKPLRDATTQHFTGEKEEIVFDSTNCDAVNSLPEYGLYYFDYRNISLSEMSIPITCTVTLYKKGVATSYYTYNATTLAEQARAFYDKYVGKDDIRTTLAVDLLNLGTAGQIYFADKGTDGNPFETYDLPNADIDQSYASEVPELSVVDGVRDSQFLSTTLELKGAPTLRYELLESTFTNPETTTFTATFTSGNVENGENGVVEYTVKGSELPTDDKEFGSMGYYFFSFDQVPLYDTNKVVTLTVTDGTKTVTHQYSILSHISTVVNSTTLAGDVFRAVASFSVGAHGYWPNY